MILLVNNTKNQWKRYQFFLLFFSIGYGKEKSNRKGNKKALQQKAKGLVIIWLPRQNDFRTFCMSDETEKVYQRLEEVINI
jgi:hypothetical protein